MPQNTHATITTERLDLLTAAAQVNLDGLGQLPKRLDDVLAAEARLVVTDLSRVPECRRRAHGQEVIDHDVTHKQRPPSAGPRAARPCSSSAGPSNPSSRPTGSLFPPVVSCEEFVRTSPPSRAAGLAPAITAAPTGWG